jgi:uncharacterized protein with HEPN domain
VTPARPPRPREDLLNDIVAWGERLAGHVAGVSAAAFERSPLAQDAVCRCLEVIGEASRNLLAADPGIAARHPDLPLRQAIAARNRIAHGYGGVDYGIVWLAATESVPAMVEAARRVLAASAAREGD